MATARVPLDNEPESNLLLHVISIGSTGQPNYPGMIIGTADTIQFKNLAPFAVKIQCICANGPVFNDIPSISPTATSATQGAQKSDITTDYPVINLSNNTSQGPYSIEVASNPQVVPAPLLIPIAAGAPPQNQSTVAVPQGGWLQFSLDDSYDISFVPSTAFSGPANPVSGTPVYRGQATNADVSYTLATARGVVGGGSVKIRS